MHQPQHRNVSERKDKPGDDASTLGVIRRDTAIVSASAWTITSLLRNGCWISHSGAKFNPLLLLPSVSFLPSRPKLPGRNLSNIQATPPKYRGLAHLLR